MAQPNENKENASLVKKFGFDESDGEVTCRLPAGKGKCTTNERVPSPSKGSRQKRKKLSSTRVDDSDDEDAGLGTTDVTDILQSFGAEVSKAIIAKRKRLRTLTNTTYKNSCQKIEELLKVQQTERKSLTDSYQKEVTGVFKQWELEWEKIKEQEDELQATLTKQQKLMQQKSMVQRQRVGVLRKLFEDFNKSSSEMAEVHKSQCSTVQLELKKEMEALQKKILMDSQNQEMANVKKSLQTLFFTP